MKKNILITTLSIVIILLLSYIVYDKYIANKNNIKDNQEIIQEKNEIITETDKVENNNNNDKIENNNDNKIENNNIKETYTEEDIVSYFNDLDYELTNYNNDKTIGDKIKDKFIKCIEFIFNNGEIGGKTFKELKNSTKLKILEIMLNVDNKIDSKIPGYKDSIKNTYSNTKSKIITTYLDITTEICNNEEELCNNAKESFKNIKNSFGLTWDFIKELAKNGTAKIKDWYEIWKYK